MRINVALPDVIRLERASDVVSLHVGSGQDRVEIDGTGNVHVIGNGGGAPVFSINVLEVLKAIKDLTVVER